MVEVDEFKYLAFALQTNRDCGREVKKRVTAG